MEEYTKEAINVAYKALDVARYVINCSNEYRYEISNLKLQKLLYFIQAFYLSSGNCTPCFDDEIEAWKFGPVVKCVYEEYRQFGANNIPRVYEYTVFDSEKAETKVYEYSDDIIKKEDRDKILLLIKSFSSFTASQLVDITHRQSPWLNACNSSDRIITKEAIKEFFLSMKNNYKRMEVNAGC